MYLKYIRLGLCLALMTAAAASAEPVEPALTLHLWLDAGPDASLFDAEASLSGVDLEACGGEVVEHPGPWGELPLREGAAVALPAGDWCGVVLRWELPILVRGEGLFGDFDAEVGSFELEIDIEPDAAFEVPLQDAFVLNGIYTGNAKITGVATSG